MPDTSPCAFCPNEVSVRQVKMFVLSVCDNHFDDPAAEVTRLREREAVLAEALDSAKSTMAFSSRDWGGWDKRDAWLYGIILGWDEEAEAELAERFKWAPDDVARLRRYGQAVRTLLAQHQQPAAPSAAPVEPYKECHICRHQISGHDEWSGCIAAGPVGGIRCPCTVGMKNPSRGV